MTKFLIWYMRAVMSVLWFGFTLLAMVGLIALLLDEKSPVASWPMAIKVPVRIIGLLLSPLAMTTLLSIIPSIQGQDS
jgi:hypothetical protein